MKWFEHHTSDRDLPHSKIIRSKFGAEGYGIYTALLEVIGENVLENNTDEWGQVSKIHDIGSLSVECATTPEKLKEFLEFCNEKEIFEKKDGRLYTGLILDRLDNYAKRIKRSGSAKFEQSSTNFVPSSNKVQLETNKVQLSTTLQKQKQTQKQKQREKGSIATHAGKMIEVFNLVMKKNYTLTEKRRRLVGDRLKAFEPQQLEQAVKNIAQSPFHRGENDRGWTADPDWLFRNDENIDKMLNLEVKPSKPVRMSPLSKGVYATT